jgi:TatA/E family protein of Tat protein translocase
MFGLSIWHLLVIGVVVFLLFGGRIADLMRAAGKSVRTGEGPASRLIPPIIPKIIKLLFP